MEKRDRMIAAWVSTRYWRLLKRVCEYRDEEVADFVRRAVLRELAALDYLPQEQRRALGMISGEPGSRGDAKE